MDRSQRPVADHLEDLARRPRLALLTDLDGTLIPFAPTLADTSFDADLATCLRALGETGVQVVVVTGRPRSGVDELITRVPGAWWLAEHGAWRFDGRTWRGPTLPGEDIDDLTRRLQTIAADVPGAQIERKTLSVCAHWRGVADRDVVDLVTAYELAIDEWLEAQPDYERLAGAATIEARPRGNHKGVALSWVRQRSPDVPVIALGDDVTDEDLFRTLGDDDLPILVGRGAGRRSQARARVEDIATARRLLWWIAEARAQRPGERPPLTELRHAPLPRSSFVVISNRTPAPVTDARTREVGGLVAALQPALQERGGLWLGWSGQEGRAAQVTLDDEIEPTRASFDFPPNWRKLFYGGLCNRALWPLLHGFPDRVRYEDEEWVQYVEANATYAELATQVANPDATIWAHDYHLLLVGAALRHRGHRGPIGMFLHIPFPARDLFETLPWASEIVDAMLAFDLIGFHTKRYVDNFVDAATGLGARFRDGLLHHRRGVTELAPLPIGIDPAPFDHARAAPADDVENMRAALGDRKLLLGVDRLDYSKGVPERLEAYERLLERHPRWRRQVSMIQVSVPSRADIPEYAQLRHRVENLVGRINGRFGEADWVPVRYLYRSYTHEVLAELYRAADVAVVTPLRDGMNLVAKEFIAAQDPARPGVLVLSRFAGAADELDAAVLTNPYHRDGLADDLDRALAMPAEERIARHGRMREAVLRNTSSEWAASFLGALARRHT